MSNQYFLPIPKLSPSDLCRFWNKIKVTSTCWLWAASGNLQGYGSFGIGNTTYVATRVAWMIYSNEDPGELLVCHICNNPRCVRKDHLYLDTHIGNSKYSSNCKRRDHRGSLHPRSKFREEDILEIRQEAIDGKTAYRIAKERGVNVSNIQKILTGELWSHV